MLVLFSYSVALRTYNRVGAREALALLDVLYREPYVL